MAWLIPTLKAISPPRSCPNKNVGSLEYLFFE